MRTENQIVARRELDQIKKTDKLIDRLIDTSSKLRSKLAYKGMRFDGIPSAAGTAAKDAMAELLAKIMDFEIEINARIDELVERKKIAFARISMISDLDRQSVLIARYIQLKPWEDIADEMERSMRTIFELHEKAIEEYGAIMQRSAAMSSPRS